MRVHLLLVYIAVLNQFKLSNIVNTSIDKYNYINIIKISVRNKFENEFMKSSINNLKNTISELDIKLTEKRKEHTGMKGIEVDINEDIEIDNSYIIYIERYGVPENGFFDPVLLYHCK